MQIFLSYAYSHNNNTDKLRESSWLFITFIDKQDFDGDIFWRVVIGNGGYLKHILAEHCSKFAKFAIAYYMEVFT